MLVEYNSTFEDIFFIDFIDKTIITDQSRMKIIIHCTPKLRVYIQTHTYSIYIFSIAIHSVFSINSFRATIMERTNFLPKQLHCEVR